MPRWSPDGKWIAFSSLRNGNFDIFLVPSIGGSARQVTYHSANDWVNDWSPDGGKILFYSSRDTRAFALYSIDLKTHVTKRLTNDEEGLRFGAWSPDGKTIAYTRAGQPWWRPWYRGSLAAQTVLTDLGTGKSHTLIKTQTQQFWPLFSADSKSLFQVMLPSNSNTPNLCRVSADGKTVQQITRYTTDAVRYPQLARKAPLLTYLWNGDLYTVQTDGTNTQKVVVFAPSDDKVNNQESQNLTSGLIELEPAPDGKTLGFVLRGEIWTIPSTGGDAKRLTEDLANDSDFNWSPDGKRMVFVSDRGNQPDVYLLEVATKQLTRLTNDTALETSPNFSPDGRWITFAKAGSTPGLYIVSSSGGEVRRLAEGNGSNNFGIGITSHAWSPDSRWVAFSRMDRYSGRDIFVVPAVGGPEINVTRFPAGDNVAPAFTRDGRRLLFLSGRAGVNILYQVPLEIEDEEEEKDENGRPKPKPDRSKEVRIDFEDIHQRASAAMPPIGNVNDFAPTPDSQRNIVYVNGSFWSITIKPGVAQQLTLGQEPAGALRVLADGSKFYYLGLGGSIRSMPLLGGVPATTPFSAQFLFDRRVLYTQAFNEFYRRFGAFFYDAKMHGVDWKALRAKYEPQLLSVATPEEFSNLLSMMVGEVNASHSEVSSASNLRGPKTASLGIRFDDDYTGAGLKVKDVLAKGPADKTKTRILPGEYLLSIDGKEANLTEDFYQNLQEKAGKTVELVVNTKPSKEGSRTIKLKPITGNEWANLDYEARVKQRRLAVERLSEGRLGYMHIRSMDNPSLMRFVREVSEPSMLAKEGLVLDIRGNGGGNTHDALLNALSRKVYGYTQPRDGLKQMQPEFAWTKPITLLIDQNSFSDAEIFPAGFRALNLGKIVGVPTPGYVIGTYGGTLVDGTSFRLPSWGWYTADGKNMENLGIPPDLYVENPPEEVVQGKDRQLEVAVQTILKQLPLKSAGTSTTKEGVGVPSSANENPNGASSAVPPPSLRNTKRGTP
jgi:tricorn protease